MPGSSEDRSLSPMTSYPCPWVCPSSSSLHVPLYTFLSVFCPNLIRCHCLNSPFPATQNILSLHCSTTDSPETTTPCHYNPLCQSVSKKTEAWLKPFFIRCWVPITLLPMCLQYRRRLCVLYEKFLWGSKAFKTNILSIWYELSSTLLCPSIRRLWVLCPMYLSCYSHAPFQLHLSDHLFQKVWTVSLIKAAFCLLGS